MSKKKLILHVGLPKTATTALQFWCDAQRDALAECGVSYPLCEAGHEVPKHQYVVGELFKGSFPRTEAALRDCEYPVLILSSEGLTNHFYDFAADSLRVFRELVSRCGYSLFVFFVYREESVWLRSYYKQAVLNPVDAKFDHGTALPYEKFVQLPRVQRLVNVEKMSADLSAGFGGEVLKVRYEDGWFDAFINVLGVADAGLGLPPRMHGSVGDDLVELVRQLNAMTLTPAQRESVLAAFQSCFNSTHTNLLNSRLRAGFSPAFLQQLQARNDAQQVMKQQLLDWHAANMRQRLFGLGRWVLK